MKSKLIKKFSSLVYAQKGNSFIRKECIESVNDEYLNVRTVSGMEYRFETKKEFVAFVNSIGFNQSN